MMMKQVPTIIFIGICCAMMIMVRAQDPPPPPLRCQNPDATFLPSATICNDEATTCAAIFTGGDDATRPPLCDNEDISSVALTCAKTCKICCETPEYNCEDSEFAPWDCSTRTRYCKQSNWTTVLTEYCPATCGLCNAGTNCRDTNSGCADMKQLCNDINFRSLMLEQGPKTCQACASAAPVTVAPTIAPSTSRICLDVATNCATNQALCNNSVYFTLMTQKCPRTCNRCSSAASSTTNCVDANSSCATWVGNGFCSNAFYTIEQRRAYCARSCNLC